MKNEEKADLTKHCKQAFLYRVGIRPSQSLLPFDKTQSFFNNSVTIG
jgi:hypothetical protein